MTDAESTAGPFTDAFSSLLARNWWAVALRGVAAIIFGLIALFAPHITLLSLVLVFAALMLADGVLNLVSGLRSARRHERWAPLILHGILDLVVGAIALVLPGVTVVAFVYLIAVWAIFSGVLEVAAAVRLRHDHGRWWMGFTGALSVVGGILLAIAPVLGAVVLTWWLGAYAIIFGGSLLVLGFRLRSHSVVHAAAPHPA
jgi:uncharacterized membrane protein HdeD (DUF308 family)